MAKSKYTVRFSRSVVSTARVTVEASSKNEALYRAGKEELVWEDSPGDAEIDSVEAAQEPATSPPPREPVAESFSGPAGEAEMPGFLDKRKAAA